VDGFATIEDFEDYDLGRKSIDFCPGFVGPGNTGFDCGFGKLEGGSITAATPEFPAASGNQMGTSINSAEHRAGRLSGRCDASDAAVAAGSGRF
jgi:hypothetical protein